MVVLHHRCVCVNRMVKIVVIFLRISHKLLIILKGKLILKRQYPLQNNFVWFLFPFNWYLSKAISLQNQTKWQMSYDVQTYHKLIVIRIHRIISEEWWLIIWQRHHGNLWYSRAYKSNQIKSFIWKIKKKKWTHNKNGQQI